MTIRRKKQVGRHVTRAVLDTTWMIQPQKLEQICQFLEARAAGVELSETEIRAAFGADEEDEDVRTINGVRLIPVMGVMAPRMNLFMRFSGGTSTQLLAQQFRAALKDPDIRAIVFEVDSPGGSAAGNEELAREIFAARGQKPIVAVVRGMAASAAYYVASAADQIVVTPSSEVGSIGTLTIHAESSKAAERAGVKYTVIQAGEFKAHGNQYTPLDEKSQGALQERIDAHYRQFVAAVARHRGITEAQVETDYGQGKVYLPPEAQRRGMVDRVASLEEILAELGTAPPAASTTRENRSVNKRIKAALYALELVDAADAPDAACETVLTIFLKTIQAEKPKTDEDLLKLLAKQFSGGAAQTLTPGTLVELRESETVEAVDPVKVAAAERLRIKDLTERRALLAQSGFTISDEVFQASIDSGESVAASIDKWTRKLEKQDPVERTGITPSGSATDTLLAAATDALLDRFDMRKDTKPLSQESRDLRHKRLIDIANADLRLRNLRAEGTNEDIASQWLALGGQFAVGSMHGSLQRAGDFPHLLSNIAGKVFDQALEIAEVTYPQWTAKIPDAADLKPHPIVALGNFDELDRIGDDEKAKQLKLDEEMPSWFQVDRYANKAGLTAVMVANDDMDSFMQGMQTLSLAHEHTLNRLCLALLTGNVQLLDGNALFDNTNHINDVTSGGAPSATEYDKMRIKHRSQRGIGNKGFVKTPPSIALFPAALETVAETTLLPMAMFGETKVPVSDSTINSFRGKIRPVIEPDLDASSAFKWYTFANPAIRRTICHVFQSGYGRGGRRTSFFDPDSETRWFRLEGRMAAFVASFRGVCRNNGQ